jgi:hypothetical protein
MRCNNSGLIPTSGASRYNLAMRFRKLRITWSVGCAIVCVLLIVLCVRSYWSDDWFQGGINSRVIQGASFDGIVSCFVLAEGSGSRWRWWSEPEASRAVVMRTHSLWACERIGINYWVKFPYWFPVVFFASVGPVPWLHWRFTLRTLLIATTLIAVVLGLVVWLSK